MSTCRLLWPADLLSVMQPSSIFLYLSKVYTNKHSHNICWWMDNTRGVSRFFPVFCVLLLFEQCRSCFNLSWDRESWLPKLLSVKKGSCRWGLSKHILVQAYSKMFVRKRAWSISKENMLWEWAGLQRRSFNVVVNEKLGELLSILAGLILQQLSQLHLARLDGATETATIVAWVQMLWWCPSRR